MSYVSAILPLFGVALGWGLKALSDYLFSRKAENRIFRKATFHILKAYKALLDYDRATTYFRQSRPPVAEFEPRRAMVEAHYIEERNANSDFTSAAVEQFASVNPALAVRLHNTLRNMDRVFRKDLTKVAEQDQETYAQLLDTQDRVVAFTLNDLRESALEIAKHSGFRQRQKVQAWIDERLKGTADFLDEMNEHADTRERAYALAREKGRRSSSSLGMDNG